MKNSRSALPQGTFDELHNFWDEMEGRCSALERKKLRAEVNMLSNHARMRILRVQAAMRRESRKADFPLLHPLSLGSAYQLDLEKEVLDELFYLGYRLIYDLLCVGESDLAQVMGVKKAKQVTEAMAKKGYYLGII